MPLLKEPLLHSKLPLKNRLVMPPMATAKASADGQVTPDSIHYYDEKTQGGYLSLVIIEHSCVSKQGQASERQLSVADDRMVENLQRLAAIIHRNGCQTAMQINHAGSAARAEVTGMPPVGPSAVRNPSKKDLAIPHELSKEEIGKIVDDFAQAAVRVKNAGFDGVEIHAAHGFLLNQFSSPLTNKRSDAYGSDNAGRHKLHLEIIRAIREAVGEGFPLLLRFGAADYLAGGLELADSVAIAPDLVKAGVDILDISGGMCRYAIPNVPIMPGYFAPLAAAIKQAVAVPVLVTGGIRQAAEAEAILQAKQADLIGVGSAILMDSHWAKNAMAGLK